MFLSVLEYFQLVLGIPYSVNLGIIEGYHLVGRVEGSVYMCSDRMNELWFGLPESKKQVAVGGCSS